MKWKTPHRKVTNIRIARLRVRLDLEERDPKGMDARTYHREHRRFRRHEFHRLWERLG